LRIEFVAVMIHQLPVTFTRTEPKNLKFLLSPFGSHNRQAGRHMLLGQTTASSVFLSLSLITCSPVHVVKAVLGFLLLLKSKKAFSFFRENSQFLAQ
jgi:hypothetical protein